MIYSQAPFPLVKAVRRKHPDRLYVAFKKENERKNVTEDWRNLYLADCYFLNVIYVHIISAAVLYIFLKLE